MSSTSSVLLHPELNPLDLVPPHAHVPETSRVGFLVSTRPQLGKLAASARPVSGYQELNAE